MLCNVFCCVVLCCVICCVVLPAGTFQKRKSLCTVFLQSRDTRRICDCLFAETHSTSVNVLQQRHPILHRTERLLNAFRTYCLSSVAVTSAARHIHKQTCVFSFLIVCSVACCMWPAPQHSSMSTKFNHQCTFQNRTRSTANSRSVSRIVQRSSLYYRLYIQCSE